MKFIAGTFLFCASAFAAPSPSQQTEIYLVLPFSLLVARAQHEQMMSAVFDGPQDDAVRQYFLGRAAAYQELQTLVVTIAIDAR